MTLTEMLKDSNIKLSQFNLVLKCFQLKLQLEQSLNIDQLVYQLYGLSDQELRQWRAPRLRSVSGRWLSSQVGSSRSLSVGCRALVAERSRGKARQSEELRLDFARRPEKKAEAKNSVSTPLDVREMVTDPVAERSRGERMVTERSRG